MSQSRIHRCRSNWAISSNFLLFTLPSGLFRINLHLIVWTLQPPSSPSTDPFSVNVHDRPAQSEGRHYAAVDGEVGHEAKLLNPSCHVER